MPIVLIMSALFLTIASGAVEADNLVIRVGGLSQEEALRLGEKMYRDGILPSGRPMQALVQGDVPVDSTVFSCSSCHLRSGLGSIEGQVVTYPVDGITLYQPMTRAWLMRWTAGSRYARSATGDIRSAYDDNSLAVAIRGGVNPDGKTLNYVMPRYPLDDMDMEILLFYLKNLSVKPSYGVVDNTIRLATIITGGVCSEDQQAMLRELKIMAGASRVGRSSKMARQALSSDPEALMNKGYVKVELSVWELKGSAEGWRSQLEAYYKKEPVFALVSGISNGDWHPIHDFCEENRVPCILPVTDSPVVSNTDWYTLYFSGGFYQEGEAVARYLNGTEGISRAAPVIHVYRNGDKGQTIAEGFDEAWGADGRKLPEKRVLSNNEQVTAEFWRQLTAPHKRAIILAWLDPKDLSSLSALAENPDKPEMIFFSSSLMGKDIYNIPARIRKISYLTYPYRLPDDFEKYQPLQPGVQKSSKSPAEYQAVREKASFNIMLITKSIFMLKGYFNRDRFLEVMDMMRDETMTTLYPRLSFGPGQRYLSKGCYIVQISEGDSPKVLAVSDWIIQ